MVKGELIQRNNRESIIRTTPWIAVKSWQKSQWRPLRQVQSITNFKQYWLIINFSETVHTIKLLSVYSLLEFCSFVPSRTWNIQISQIFWLWFCLTLSDWHFSPWNSKSSKTILPIILKLLTRIANAYMYTYLPEWYATDEKKNQVIFFYHKNTSCHKCFFEAVVEFDTKMITARNLCAKQAA